MIKKFNLILTLSLILSGNLFAENESKEMCDCLKVNFSKSAKEKRKCLVLQEKHFKKIGKNKEAKENYKKEVSACENNLSNPSSGENLSFDEKVKEVCDCFAEVKASGKRPMKCFKLQGKYSSTLTDQKTEFNQQTNSCAN